MSPDKNRKRTHDLRWAGFQSILAGIVIIMVVGLFYFMSLEGDSSSQSGSYLKVKGLVFWIIIGVLGLAMIVRGAIYLIRAQSGDDHYAKSVVDLIDKSEKGVGAMMRPKVKGASMHNVLALLVWIFLFLVLAIVGVIVIGYLF